MVTAPWIVDPERAQPHAEAHVLAVANLSTPRVEALMVVVCEKYAYTLHRKGSSWKGSDEGAKGLKR